MLYYGAPRGADGSTREELSGGRANPRFAPHPILIATGANRDCVPTDTQYLRFGDPSKRCYGCGGPPLSRGMPDIAFGAACFEK